MQRLSGWKIRQVLVNVYNFIYKILEKFENKRMKKMVNIKHIKLAVSSLVLPEIKRIILEK